MHISGRKNHLPLVCGYTNPAMNGEAAKTALCHFSEGFKGFLCKNNNKTILIVNPRKPSLSLGPL